MVDVSVSTTIRRPVEEVAAFAADPMRAPEWYRNIKRASLLDSPPVGEGSHVAFEADFLGRRLAYTYEVVEYVSGRRMVMRTAEGPFPMQTDYVWEPDGESATRMTLRNSGTPRGFSRFAAPFMALAMRAANRKDLAELKRILESSQAAR